MDRGESQRHRLRTKFVILSCILIGALSLAADAALQQQRLSILSYSPEDIESEDALSSLYDLWCKHYGKACSNSNAIRERQKRLQIFKENLHYIIAHNRGNHSYWLGLNQFSDLSNEEFRQRFFGLRVNATALRSSPVAPENENKALPESVDWRKKGAVTAPKDQGNCGGCWAFSTTGAIEGINQILTGNLISLSEQELLDCDTAVDNGCDGGLMENAFQFIINNGGIDTETDYPYKAVQGKCDKNKENARVVAIDSYKTIAEGDEKSILQAVARQPVSVAIEGASRAFQHYAEGVFTGPCGEEVNHGVLVVGYGSENGLDYWIVKNSWGATWGAGGFVKMRRNMGVSKGLCSINTLASFPVKSGDNPPFPGPKPPSPDPEHRCDKLQTCPADTTCCCRFPIGPLCLSWGCCNVESAVCCPDHRHCCPHDYPVCSPSDGLCLKKSSDTTGVKLMESTPAMSSVEGQSYARKAAGDEESGTWMAL